jgi:hypothetical protein
MESVFRSITRNEDLIHEWIEQLNDYDYVDDDPEIGVYSRYIDLREYPPKLKNGGIIVEYTDKIIQFKIGWPKPCFWTIQRDFNAVFQKRSFRKNLLKLVKETVAEKLGNTE